MPTRLLKAGMKIDHSIVDRLGRNLVTKGAILDDYVIDSMLKLGIMAVYIQDGEMEPEDTESITCKKAQQQIEKLRTADRAKVNLSASVRERVSQGIQYIYNNPEDEGITAATNSIANELMTAIETNDAVAIDISALKTSDEYTFKHSVDVATISMILAKKQGLDSKKVYEIGIAGLLHDVGKTKVPLEILNKPGPLNDDEFEIMKQHTVYGYRIVQENAIFNNEIALTVLQHHEKINGNGYPLKANANQITPYAKIMTIADIYDALVTDRPYKAALPQRTAIEMIMSMTDELDITAMKSFLESIILYPVDSIVTLSTGEKARVVKNTAHYSLRPIVVSLSNGNVYDLGGDLECAHILINS